MCLYYFIVSGTSALPTLYTGAAVNQGVLVITAIVVHDFAIAT
jgi:hypothetical protein